MTRLKSTGGIDGWSDVWSRRRLEPSRGTLIAQLLAADGFNTPFGGIEPESWEEYVRVWAGELGATAATSVFEVGCGAGAFLYPMHRMGCRVGGVDQATALVDIALEAMPGAKFAIGDDADLPVTPTADVVLSFSVFQYFPSLSYARNVLERMAAKATRAVGIFDLPDSARREEALAERIASAGGAEAYTERYAGLDHLHYTRSWVEDVMRSCGLTRVRSADQELRAYANAPFRFNAWGAGSSSSSSSDSRQGRTG